MSLITSGVKIRLWPSRLRARGEVSSATVNLLEHELSLGGLERVVVVELLAAHELLELRRRAESVDRELALNQLAVGIGPLAGHAVDPKRGDLGDIDLTVVDRVAQPRADVAADDLAPALHHEARHRTRVAEHDDRAALLVDAGAR